MALDISSNLGSATVVTGGTDAPGAGTIETFVVSSPVDIPTITSGVTQFRFVDAAQASNPSEAEIMICTATNGASWTVVRGAEAIGGNGTTPVSHAANWKAVLVVTKQALSFNNSTVNVLRYATPAFDLNSSLDVVSNSTTTFTSATANWIAGQNLIVRGAGAASTAVYEGVISSVSGSSATCSTAASTSGASLQAFWFTDDTVAWQTALNNAPAGSTLDGPVPFASAIMQRLDIGCTVTNNSSSILDSNITAADAGKWVMAHPVVTFLSLNEGESWTGIPVGTFVGWGAHAPLGGASFTLVNGQNVPVNATASISSASLSVGGLYIPSSVQLCPEIRNRSATSTGSAGGIPISTNIRQRGRVFGVVQCSSLSASDSGAGALVWSSPNAMFGLTDYSAIGAPTIYSLNQVSIFAGTPTTFAPTVAVVTPQSSGWFVGSVYIPNAYTGLSLQGGLGHVANPLIGAFNVGVVIDHDYDYLQIDSLTLSPQWDHIEGSTFGNSTGLDLYAMENLNGLVVGRCDGLHINRMAAVITSTGIYAATTPDSHFTTAGAVAVGGTIDSLDLDQACNTGIYCTSVDTALILSSVSMGANAQAFGPAASSAIGAWTNGSAAKVVIKSWVTYNYSGSNASKQTSGTLIVPATNPG